jgi:trimethylamine---corrinoid protein Co-methyltransferase
MSRSSCNILSDAELRSVHEASLTILRDTGVLVQHPEVVHTLVSAGASVESVRPIVHLPETLVMESIARAGKSYVLHGRDTQRTARFGAGELMLMSSPGQHAWFDAHTDQLRPATLDDAREAIRLGDALPNINIVGAMAQPAGMEDRFREVLLAAELIKGTTKPTRSWVSTVESARWIMELFRAVAGGEAALRDRPMTEGFLTPISPLQFPEEGLAVLREFIRAGQPVCIASMPMAIGTAPVTLAGAMALANAELLAGNVITQQLGPGTPVLYGGIPHIMDPRTTMCSFGAPEQAVMAVGMTQLGRHYGFPVYINVGLTDAKTLDLQAGMEKGATLAWGARAGAELFGHAGIRGADHGASLVWLCADNELLAYVKRMARGFQVSPETLATDIVHAVRPGGNFLAEEHTVKHLRRELWLPGAAWTRQAFGVWESDGCSTMADRLRTEGQRLLKSHQPAPITPELAAALDEIVARAKAALR